MKSKTVFTLIAFGIVTVLAMEHVGVADTININTYTMGPIQINSGTTLNVQPTGSVIGTDAFAGEWVPAISSQDGIVNINGGSVIAGEAQYGATYGINGSHSFVNINGGNIKSGNASRYSVSVAIASDSSLNIYGGIITGGDMLDDYAETSCIFAYGNSTTNIYGGSFTAGYGIPNNLTGAAYAIMSAENSILNIYGGSIINSNPFEQGYLPGIYATENSRCNIYGTGFNYCLGPINENKGVLTGTLTDGTPLNLTFWQDYPGQIIVVPEPATLLLLGLGAAIAVRKQK